MYWQIYYHKTVISEEFLLVEILKRAKFLLGQNMKLFSTPALNMFLQNSFNQKDFDKDKSLLEKFSMLDDFDIFASIKVWSKHQDNILSRLCKNLINRHLYGVEIRNTPFENTYVNELKNIVAKEYKISKIEAGYFVFTNIIKNYAYNPKRDKINILYNDGTVVDIAEASGQLNVDVLSKTVTKYFLCYPKEFFFTKR